MSQIASRYQQVLARVASACLASGRSVDEVELVAITKNHPAEVVAELVDLGQLVFGENRDQEAAPKSLRLRELRPDSWATWHFVGQLQTNKVKSVLSYASVIHSIDRPSLVSELAKQLPKFEGHYAGFIELNLTSDPGRGGVLSENLSALAQSVLEIENFNLLGVMAVAGLGEDPRSEFDKVLKASEKLQHIAPQAKQLSIGMSDDFEIAIAMGATHIRVGSAITGPRPSNA